MMALTLCLISVTTFCQKTIGTFQNEYFEKECYVLYDEENGKYYIQIVAQYKTTNCCFIVNDVENFKQQLSKVKEKYSEWCKVAKENNVTSMDKYMDIEFKTGGFGWYGTQWWFNFYAKPKPRFLIFDNEYLCLLFSGQEFTSSSNRYISEKAYWVFSSVEEIEQLEKLLSKETLEKMKSEESNKESLFK